MDNVRGPVSPNVCSILICINSSQFCSSSNRVWLISFSWTLSFYRRSQTENSDHPVWKLPAGTSNISLSCRSCRVYVPSTVKEFLAVSYFKCNRIINKPPRPKTNRRGVFVTFGWAALNDMGGRMGVMFSYPICLNRSALSLLYHGSLAGVWLEPITHKEHGHDWQWLPAPSLVPSWWSWLGGAAWY